MALISLLLLSIASLCTIPVATDSKQPTSLSAITKALQADVKMPGEELVDAGVKLIKEGGARLVDDLAFMTAVGGRQSLGAQRLKSLETVASALTLKYKDDSESLLRVLLLEAVLYRDCFQDRAKEREILLKAETLQQSLLVQRTLSQLEIYVNLGDSHLNVLDPQTKTAKKAREYYEKAIEIEFPALPTSPQYRDYQALYIKAAIRLVDMTKGTELKRLRFHSFAFAELEKLYPDKAKHLSREDPWVTTFNAKLERWLEFTARDLPKDSPMRPHFEGVLQYIRKDKP